MYRRRRVGDAFGDTASAAAAPFKPLQLNREPASTFKLEVNSKTDLVSPTLKKPKLESSFPKRHQRPLISIPTSQPESTKKVVLEDKRPSRRKYSAVWRKFSTKKNKTWEGDGIIIIDKNSDGILKNESGKVIARTKLENVKEGDSVRMGMYEAQLDTIIVDEDDIATGSSPTPILPSMSPALRNSFSLLGTRGKLNSTPRFDPNTPGAIVLPRPRPEPLGKTIIDVVVDPSIGKKLRPHQVEGVKFLYQCIMGMKHHIGHGALLADEMGLGKTLLTIALLWTLLKQNPIQGETPVLKRVLIVCPVTLITNWQNEFNKWLGRDRIGVFVADSKSRIRDFTGSKVYPIMIIGYEKVRTLVNELKSVKFDIIVCDEGHRLKSSTNKSAQALISLNTEKKIILSGTPIQNDLGEFFVMIDFLNPGILGTYASFKKEFEGPIMKSRQPGALKKDIATGRQKSEELSRLTQQFIIRRTAKTLDNYLPPKTESVLFCYPTKIQLEKYERILGSSEMKAYIGSNDASDHLRAITLLKKVCNSPSLIEEESNSVSSLASAHFLPLQSGKTRVLMLFLKHLYNETNEKVVIVSGFTQTLDLIESMIRFNSMSFLRLDGSTNQNKRQKLVDDFNKTDQKENFIFLLSSRSGGVGLNLVGASRLFLFDTDWNPSIDLQAMARIHRDGQQRPVFIYRLLVCGAIDEKIYQRQVTKQGLADRFMGEDTTENDKPKQLVHGNSFSSDSFAADELRELFILHQNTPCNTHDMLECQCLKLDGIQESLVSTQISDTDHSSQVTIDGPEELSDSDDDLGGWVSAKIVADVGIHIPNGLKKKDKLKGLFDYTHIDPVGDVTKLRDEILLNILSESPRLVSFIFTKSTTIAQCSDSDLETSNPTSDLIQTTISE